MLEPFGVLSSFNLIKAPTPTAACLPPPPPPHTHPYPHSSPTRTPHTPYTRRMPMRRSLYSSPTRSLSALRPCHRPPPDRCPDQGVNAVSNKGYAFFHYADPSVTDTCIAALHGFQAPYRLTTPRLLLSLLLTDEVLLRFLSHLPTNDCSPPLSPSLAPPGGQPDPHGGAHPRYADARAAHAAAAGSLTLTLTPTLALVRALALTLPSTRPLLTPARALTRSLTSPQP